MNDNSNIFMSADGKFRVRVVRDYSGHLAGQHFGLIIEELTTVHTFVPRNGQIVRIDKDGTWVETGSRWRYHDYKNACDDAKALVAEYEARRPTHPTTTINETKGT